MKKTLLLLAMSCFIGVAQFTEQSPIDATPNQFESFVVDMDNDGFNDVVYHNDGGIQWRSNAGGEGTFHQIHQIYTEPEEVLSPFIVSIAAADIDADGDIDIAFATQGSESPGVAWIENLGGGEFGEYVSLIPDVGMRRVYFEDVDADGDPDLIANIISGPDGFDDHILMLENLGGGLFETPVSIAYFYLHERVTTFGDLDGDGDLDAIIGVKVLNELYWYENLDGTSFGPAAAIDSDFDNMTDLHATDIDEDGDLDLAYVTISGGRLSWVENTGGGIFGDTHLIYDCAYPKFVSFDDFDTDGDLDLVLTYTDGAGGQILSVFEKTAPAVYGAPIEHYSSEIPIRSISTGDLNMDGTMEILFTGTYHNQCAYLTNEGAMDFSEPNVVIGQNINSKQIINADINGNGRYDLITLSEIPGNVIWYANELDSTFGAPNFVITDLEKVETMTVFDVDNDTDNDLIISSHADSTIFWLENLGGGTFAPLVIIEAGPTLTHTLIPIDINDDGNIDLIQLGNAPGEVLSYYENSGGAFGPAVTIPTSATYIVNAEVNDMNLDGTNDLVIYADPGGGQFLWFENTGGAFAAEVVLATVLAENFKIGDLNDDGDLDIIGIYSDIFDPRLFWVENLGGMTYAEPEIIAAFDLGYRGLALSDINNDSNMDIVVAGYHMPEDGGETYDEFTGQITWYENLGGAVFTAPVDITKNLRGYRDMNLIDLEGDGDDEIFTASTGDYQLTWFKNFIITPQQVQGKLYFDENENGTLDLGEVGLGGIQIESDPLGDFAYTYEDGNYVLNFTDPEYGDYLVFPQELEHWGITSDPVEYTVTVDETFTGESDLDFGLFPIDDETEVVNSLIAGYPRCNSVINYYISYENIGATLASGIIALELHEEITYVDADIAPDSIVDLTYYWSFEDLYYFDETHLNLRVEMPSAEFIGDTLTSYSTITALDDAGIELFVHEDSLAQILICGYDPNDKTVSPKGTGEFGNIPPTTPFLEYTVRFQNTGTDTAFNIVIKDQLDENLDWSSLEILGHSDPMVTYIDHLGEVSFTFNDIMLPDSNVNESASHGFVKYRIDLLPDPSLGTIITNMAGIYFDANPVVLTNTTINTIAEDEIDDSGILENKTETILVYPNPFSETTTIYFGEALGDNLTVRVFDVLGHQVFQQSNILGNKYELSGGNLGKGLYILTVESDKSNRALQTVRLVVQ
jgi:hypothetical protein